MKFFSFISLVLSITAVAINASEPPNFVVIFTDDQGYADVGCFGSKDIRTPRLNAMAKEGMKFTSFYAQTICGPSRAAIMTGCYPMRVAERGNTKQVHPILHSEEITIAEVLKTKGYATACFGKWDLAKHAQSGFFMDLFPTRQGFDYFYGTPTSNDGIVNLYRNEKLIEPKSNMATLTKRYTDEAIQFIEKNKEKPFFVYIPHTMPHTRLDASAQFKGKSKRGLYGDVIEEIDFNVGRILDAIKEMDLSDNTYVLFTSDNGPWHIKNKNHADGHLPGDHGGSAGPLRSAKVSTFEGGFRVPTILWGPGRVPTGKTCESIASTLDLLPTFAKLAGACVPNDRVIDVFHMSAQLMFPAGFRLQLHQTVSTRGVTLNRHRQFGRRQPAIPGERLTNRLLLTFETSVFRLIPERVVDHPLLRCPAPDHRQIGFAHPPGHHRQTKRTRRLRIPGKQQDTRGGTIQPVHGVDMLTAVHSPGILQGKFGFVLVDRTAVHQQSGWLVHGQQPVVPINFSKRVQHVR